MGHEIAGAMGIEMAEPERGVVCMVRDGSHVMASSEFATAAMLRLAVTVVVTDNRGYGRIGFAAHAASLGAEVIKVGSTAGHEAALARRGEARGPYAIVIDPYPSTSHGGAWCDVAVPEVSSREEVREARAAYEARLRECA